MSFPPIILLLQSLRGKKMRKNQTDPEKIAMDFSVLHKQTSACAFSGTVYTCTCYRCMFELAWLNWDLGY